MVYDIYINDEISRDVVSAAYVERMMRDAIERKTQDGTEAMTLNVYVNSLGGDVAEALKIMQVLRDADCKTVAHVYGLTASAATIVMLGCTEVRVSRYASIMVHNCWQAQDIFGGYDAEALRALIRDLEKDARALEAVDGLILKIYEDATGLTAEKLTELMRNDTWMTAEDAVRFGFADGLEEAGDDDLSAPPVTGYLKARLMARALPLPGASSLEGSEASENSEGSEGSEGSENSEGSEGSEGSENSEGSEGSEGSEASENSENSEGSEGSEEAESPEVADIAESIADLRAENAALREQIEALRGLPADDTLAIEGAGGSVGGYDAARASYRRVFGK